MDDKITIGLDRETFDELSRQAELHGQSVDEEAGTIVRQALGTGRLRMSGEELIRRAREIRAMTPKGVAQTDSLTLLREDRDR